MKRYLPFAVMVVFLVGANFACAQAGDAKAGKAVYDKSCATCHSADGSPKEAIAKMLKVEIPHLGAKEVQDKSDADLKKVVTDGYEKMKPVKGLAEKDLTNVIAFVRTLKTS
ncbi:MAG: cytochrome c [Acidobacteria bacterium]|nr:cytochrome c [Acidobacteriota bacterium]